MRFVGWGLVCEVESGDGAVAVGKAMLQASSVGG